MFPKVMLFAALTLFVINCYNASAQVEVQGAAAGGVTKTFVAINNNTPPDTAMVILDNGKVGIGTTTPTRKLEVNGIIYTSSGGYMFPDGSVMFTASYANVFTVAQTGGDFNSIQQAINACVAPSKTNPYLVRVMPGVYSEPPINCKKFVDLRGSGKHSCYITGTVNGEDSCLIENFNILQGIYCNGKSPFILHNMITRTDSASACGIKVVNMGRPWIKENDIIDCNGYGILCEGFGCDSWIIANNILRNQGGGIRCQHSSPTISNNFIDYNLNYGIYVAGQSGTPAEPTIDDNIISNTSVTSGYSIGISISFESEPRIIANDIYVNDVGIEIDDPAKPSIIGNNINYNDYAGIVTYSSAGLNKNVVIMANHIHNNTGTGNPFSFTSAGISVMQGDPMISQNNVSQNRTNPQGTYADIDYSNCTGSYPMISLNVYDWINRAGGGAGPGPAGGLYNVTSAGVAINP